MKIKLITLLLALPLTILAQKALTGKELVKKSIQYHDPENKWSTFNDSLLVTMETPKSSDRVSLIKINLPESYFYVSAKKDTLTTEYTVKDDNCTIALNGNTNLTEAVKTKHKLSCDRAKLYRNYYSYLYGLPMKLKDKGTVIDDTIEQKTFKGKTYNVVKVTYDKAIGSDVWYFYFNPTNNAMQVYQFYKTDNNGNIKPDSGEYILLDQTETISGIKMPKNRAWYYNKNDDLLGTDILSKAK